MSTLNNVESLSKIRARRGDDRTEHELDDIFTVITELDEKQTLSQLLNGLSQKNAIEVNC